MKKVKAKLEWDVDEAREDRYIQGFKKARAVVVDLLDGNVSQMDLFGPESEEDE